MDLLPQVLADSLLLAGLYSLMAVGMSLSFGIIRIVNFAHGEMVMLGAYGAYWLFVLLGIDPLVSLPLVLIAGFCFGWVLFRAVIAKVLDAPHLNQILLTFGIGLVIQNFVVLMWSANARSTTPDYATSSWIFGNLFLPQGRVIAFIVASALITLLIVWLNRSETGRATRAVAENRAAATLMGINVRKIYALSFGVSCALGAATGVIVSFVITITPLMGFPILIKAVAIVILGGMGSIVGAVAGAFILALGETFLSYYVIEGAGWAEGLAFVSIFAILLLRPRGIFGQAVETQS